ncbi:hypothetical protein Patl1_08484 [Pistacia atlantica]|uniref:Uncharacterized protein n=1 Tax=Pistacia atlantica TaxID=434234 RepID=A0ACC1AI87_9ROSI|nr:hypothetical protein Patl1_08484 [Pistacia atlantica]
MIQLSILSTHCGGINAICRTQVLCKACFCKLEERAQREEASIVILEVCKVDDSPPITSSTKGIGRRRCTS